MQDVRTGSKQLIREINQALVLDVVRRQGSASRTDIAALTGLSPPTVSGITGELIERGFLYEAATGESAGGRRPILLSLNAAAGYVIGAKVTEHEVIGVLTDLEARIVAQSRVALRARDHRAVVNAIGRLASRLSAKANGAPVYGIGVGLAGVVDRASGKVRHATYLTWHDVDLASELAERTGLFVVVDNDINALVANELWFRHGRDIANLLVISLGRGVGLGMVLGGDIHRGAVGGAGEFGHVTIDPDGPACPCGKSGCLEAYVSDPALERQLRENGAVHDLPAAFEAAAADPSGPEATILARAATTLGRAVADLVNVLNPNRIVFTGEGARLIDGTGAATLDALQQFVFDGLGDELEIVVEAWDDTDWARGAAAVVLGDLFQPPLRRGDVKRPSLAAR